MKICVVGAGIFGITTAVKLAKKYQVDLFEKKDDIFCSTSGINQYRLHRGYHYPRAKQTVMSLLKSERSFKAEYAEAIIDDVDHYYCISKRDSLTSPEDYISFCKNNNLEFNISNLEIVRNESVDLCIKVKESLFDPHVLKNICWKNLKKSNTKIFLGEEATEETLEDYDVAIISTYSTINKLLNNFPESQLEYQFELCEKPVVKLPDIFQKKSIVIMDGPFMSLDPFGRTDNFVMGNVIHAIHHTNIGKNPEIDKRFIPYLDNGIIKNPKITNYDLFIDSAAEFMPAIKRAEHVGSMYTVRTVLPNVEMTDERPTIVRKINDKILTIFSGKIPTCAEAAEQVYQLLNSLKK